MTTKNIQSIRSRLGSSKLAWTCGRPSKPQTHWSRSFCFPPHHRCVSEVSTWCFLSLAARSKLGSVKVAAGGVVLAVLEVRLSDIWGG